MQNGERHKIKHLVENLQQLYQKDKLLTEALVKQNKNEGNGTENLKAKYFYC